MNQLTTYKTEDAYVNITPIAKHYGKKTADYLKLQKTKWCLNLTKENGCE